MKRGVALGILFAMVMTAGPTLAQTFGLSPTDHTFKIDWNPTTTRRGQPAIEGYVVNQTGYAFRGVEVAVDGTDTSGGPLPTTIIPVNGEVSGYDRLYFKGALKAAGRDYRVTLRSYERFGGGGGGM
jgi:hypothetical protein